MQSNHYNPPKSGDSAFPMRGFALPLSKRPNKYGALLVLSLSPLTRVCSTRSDDGTVNTLRVFHASAIKLHHGIRSFAALLIVMPSAL